MKLLPFSFILMLAFSSCVRKIPLVYSKENSGASFKKTIQTEAQNLPLIEPLPDPFLFNNSSSRVQKFKEWEKRRNEILAEIEYYEIGIKPPKPANISASFSDSTLTVTVTENGQTLTLTANIWLPPNGKKPFPAVIGMNRLSGSLPSEIFRTRNIAMISFNHKQVTVNGNSKNTDPYYLLYPSLNIDNSGQYSAWAWGVSRLIDGLELVKNDLPIDTKHIAVTGCSYAGKMALFSGAFDERIVLTIAQESGGGGATAWRVSEQLGAVEKLGNTSHHWFKEHMFDYKNSNVSRLPYDHHELMAMVAPRALLVTGNTDYMWLSNPSNYITSQATHEIYKNLGIPDRFGYYIDGGHRHCSIPDTQLPSIEAFVDKYLLEKDVETNVYVHPYPEIDYQRWISWWGTNKPEFPHETFDKFQWIEAECGEIGKNFLTEKDGSSSGQYVVSKPGITNSSAPKEDSSLLVIPFNIDSSAYYTIQARVNCPDTNSDGFWFKLDEGGFENANSLTTNGWEWKSILYAKLSKGKHTMTFGIRENGAKLDKILITNSLENFNGIGGKAINCE